MQPHIALLLVLTAAAAHGASLRRYDRDWLMSDASDAAAALAPRRITAKSVFVAPSNVRCASGWRADADGRCVRVVTVSQQAQINFLSQKLNALFAGGLVKQEKITAMESAPVVKNSTTTTQKPTIESSTIQNQVDDIDFSGDKPTEIDIFESSADTVNITNEFGTATSTENVFLVPDNETSTSSTDREMEVSTEVVEVRPEVIVVEPALLVRDDVHAVDSVQVLEEDLEVTTSTEETSSVYEDAASVSDETPPVSEESTSSEYLNDHPVETIVILDSNSDIVEISENKGGENALNATHNSNQDALEDSPELGVTPEKVQIVYAQVEQTIPERPLVIDLKPNEDTYQGAHLQNHNLNPSKLAPPFLENTPPSLNRFPDYPFGLDEIRRRPPQRPLRDDFNHRDSHVRFPDDHRVNVVKFPQDNGGGGKVTGWMIDPRRRPPPPQRFRQKVPGNRNQEWQLQFDGRRRPVSFY